MYIYITHQLTLLTLLTLLVTCATYNTYNMYINILPRARALAG